MALTHSLSFLQVLSRTIIACWRAASRTHLVDRRSSSWSSVQIHAILQLTSCFNVSSLVTITMHPKAQQVIDQVDTFLAKYPKYTGYGT
jgi:hypothetical protein